MESQFLFKEGDLVRHKLNNITMVILKRKLLHDFSQEYLVRFIDYEGKFKCETVYEHELRAKGE